ncbi:EF-hand domain-containing protein [Tepidicaulis sp. LMO-SS28]|uniref:EF-hand domain-containing protein n=1 Tax=Tepidicaulis sp. LMO-SS28 TaxID=3447455 RepID=UPI003EE32C29
MTRAFPKTVTLLVSLAALGLLAGCGSDDPAAPGPGGRLPGEPLQNPKVTAILKADLNDDSFVTTEEYDEYLRQFFIASDQNGDGYLDDDEWEEAGEKAGAFGIATAGFPAVDLNGNGYISIQELLSLPRFAFNEIDTSRDGTITPQELDALPGVRVRDDRGPRRRDLVEEGKSGNPDSPW